MCRAQYPITDAHLEDMLLSCYVALLYAARDGAGSKWLVRVNALRYSQREQAIFRGDKEHESQLRVAWLEGVDEKRVTLQGHPLFELRRC